MIVAPIVQKGGNGKTTTCLAIAQAGAKQGKKTLIVDLNPQADSSFSCGAASGTKTSLDLLRGTPADELIQQTETGVDIIPACYDLMEEQSSEGSYTRLRTALEPIRNKYDLILLDTPAAGEMQLNALGVADKVILPLQADQYSLNAIYYTLNLIAQAQRINTTLKISGVIITRHTTRSKIKQQFAETIQATAAQYNIPVLGVVPESVSVLEAQALKQNLFDYAPNSKPAVAYMRIYKVII